MLKRWLWFSPSLLVDINFYNTETPTFLCLFIGGISHWGSLPALPRAPAAQSIRLFHLQGELTAATAPSCSQSLWFHVSRTIRSDSINKCHHHDPEVFLIVLFHGTCFLMFFFFLNLNWCSISLFFYASLCTICNISWKKKDFLKLFNKFFLN